MQETIFEKHKTEIDSLLSVECVDVLKKVPSIYDRLSAQDPEAVSQALNSCRRIIDAFADSVFPPKEGTFKIGGNELKLTAQHNKNRINVFIYQRCKSDSLRERLKKRLDSLYERVTTGVHSDVSSEEAKCLFLDTYLLLGEILSISKAT